MPVREDLGTVLVRCTGLAMICAKEAAPQGEVGFLRDDKHAFTFKILRPFYRNGSDNLISYSEVASYKEFPNENVCIEIEAQDTPAGCRIHKDADFNRLGSTNDKNDFQWLVNLGEFHATNALRSTSQQPYSLSRLNLLSGGLFYSHQLDQRLVFSKVMKNVNGANSQPEQFGRVAKTLGVRLDGNQVVVRIRSNGMEATHSLPRVPGFPSIIELSNVDPDPYARYSDMGDYYKYMHTPGGEQFELKPLMGTGRPPVSPDEPGLITRPGDPWAEPMDPAGEPPLLLGSQKNQQDFCHPVVLPLESLNEL